MTIGDERPHKRLEVWQRSMVLVKKIYDLTKEFPKKETYGLSSQMQRSAVSIRQSQEQELAGLQRRKLGLSSVIIWVR